MSNDIERFNQIALSFAKHYDCVYYVDVETNHYDIFSDSVSLTEDAFPCSGEDFFSDACKNAEKYIHPNDLEHMLEAYKKESILLNLSQNDSFSVAFRSVNNGNSIHMRFIAILSSDKKHIICCLENVEAEFHEKETQFKNLQSAKLMARRDELTGVKNYNAFKELENDIDNRIADGEEIRFGIVMCDVNDLKKINDTRGHSFGDEAIQRACRMICEVYKHSPVFRIGGDEFAVILSDCDYEQREDLLKKLKEESIANRLSRSGPEVACGMADYTADNNEVFADVFKRADSLMYENKKALKSGKNVEGFKKMEGIDEHIPDERKRLLDGMFGALLTVAGGGYVYLNDMKYDYSRWALSLIDDFGLKSEYMYHADNIWMDYIHPDDIQVYKEAVEAVLRGNAEVRPICYRARKADGTYLLLATRGFVLSDKEGNPEYFGGIIIPKE